MMKRKLVVFAIFCALFCVNSIYGQAPVAAFSADITSGCAPQVIRFTDLSTNNPTSYFWDLGNGVTSSAKNPTTTYTVPGKYTVKLTVTNSSGSNTTTKVEYITIHNLPTVNFESIDTIGCAPHTSRFFDRSIAGSGSITSWQWIFGDGGNSGLANPVYTYTNPGDYGVFLKVTNSFGCSGAGFKADYVKVGQSIAGNFNFSIPVYCKLPVEVNFNSQVQTQEGVTYNWDFGDGGKSTHSSPKHIYTSNGNFLVRLIIKSNSGCTDTITKTVVLSQVAAVAKMPDFLCLTTVGNFSVQSTPLPTSCQWFMGDGKTYSTATVSHAYTTPGNYEVRVVMDFGNCKDTIKSNVTVQQPGKTDFFSADTFNCRTPHTVRFNDLSEAPMQWLWEFGDGKSSTAQNPVHTYLSAGNYTVKLTTTNSNGCTSQVVKTAYIKVASGAIKLNNVPASGCAPFTFTPSYTVNAPGGIATYLWDFGNGFTSTSSQPTGVYINQGNYNFNVILTTNNGCRDTITVQNGVRVGTTVNVDFSASPSTTVCSSTPIKFTSVVSSPVQSYLWNFGNNNTSTAANPTHLFRDTGYFTVSLTVDINGCKSVVTKKDVVHIIGPIGRFTVKKDCNNKGKFEFANISKNHNSIFWEFGDGNTSTATSPTHVFTTQGIHKVKLTVTNDACIDTVSINVPVWFDTLGIKPTANVICRKGVITYDVIHPYLSAIRTYNWDFGNVSYSGTRKETRSYPNSGDYYARVIIVDTFGCRDSVRINNIRVNGAVPNFKVNNPLECISKSVVFSDLSTTDGLHNIVEWRYDFGDNNQQTFSAPPFSHTYSVPGVYNVKLRVTDQSGCRDSITIQKGVTIQKATAGFVTTDSFTCIGKSVAFKNLSTGNIQGYKWEFGDGTTSTLTDPVHQFAASGKYSVKLVVYTSAGCNDSIVRSDYINVDVPKAKFAVSDTFAKCPPVQINFTDSSTYVSSWNWQFGNGVSSTLQNPNTVYFAPGNFTARLIATSPGGCKDTAYQRIHISGPTGKLEFSPLKGCSPHTVKFEAKSLNGANGITWDFGDGNVLSTTDTVVSYTYTTRGRYNPIMLLKDPTGCVLPYSSTEEIFVEQLMPDFGVSKSVICEGGSVSFTDSTTSLGNYSYNWNFGDGITSNLKNPVHQYLNPGLYTVKLVVTSPIGCMDSIVKTNIIKVIKYPGGKIVAGPVVCIGDIPFSFQVNPDTSAITSYQWNFGNGKTSTLSNPVIRYDVPGIYTVSLTIVNSSGCQFTTSKSIEVKPNPLINLTPNTSICLGNSVQLLASGGASYKWLAPGSASLSCTNCPNPVATPTADTKYKVEVISAFGCSSIDSVTVKVLHTYTLATNNSYSICEGATVQLNASGAPNYTWSPAVGLNSANISNPIAKPDTTTLYTVTGYDTLGCFTQKMQVLISVSKNPTVDVGPDIHAVAGSSLPLTPAYSSNVVKYTWLPSTNLSCSNCPNPVLEVRDDINYRIVVNNNKGCIGMDSLRVFVTCAGIRVYIPNTFSPNGDGMNDIFYPRGSSLFGIKTFKIFNKWGELVFFRNNITNNDPSAGWNGFYKGKKAEQGVYMYQVEVICNSDQVKSFTGSIHLIQ